MQRLQSRMLSTLQEQKGGGGGYGGNGGGGRGPEEEDGDLDNPFRLPSDEQVFLMRDEERQQKLEERETQRSLKVWEKTTSSSRMMTTTRVNDADIPLPPSQLTKQAKNTRGLVAAATAAISNDRRREKENMADFIEKKREMFLVQMSLDTKREEIRKLEEKAQMKEEALKKSELMLEEDAIRFDTFLKENDTKAHEAIKKAEHETKAKADKVTEIKKLNMQIAAVKSEMSKLNESLEDCLKYKKFLDDLTPPEFFQKQKDIKRARQVERRDKRRALKTAEWEEQKGRIEVAFEQEEKAREEQARREGRSSRKKGAAPRVPQFPPEPTFNEEDDITNSGEELPMYFTEPQQLLDIFTQLEEQNLFLIQNSQETEQALEELRQQFNETKRKMQVRSRAHRNVPTHTTHTYIHGGTQYTPQCLSVCSRMVFRMESPWRG